MINKRRTLVWIFIMIAIGTILWYLGLFDRARSLFMRQEAVKTATLPMQEASALVEEPAEAQTVAQAVVEEAVSEEEYVPYVPAGYVNVDYKKILEDLYQDVSGYRISDVEKQGIRELGGDPTYGEIVYDSAKILLNDLVLTADDVFYDLGSGAGKFVDQAYLTTPAKKSAGIELSETRYKMAADRAPKIRKIAQLNLEFDAQVVAALADAQKAVKPKVTKTLEFIHDNILSADLSDATVVFMCATCFSNELMTQITEKLAGLKEGLRVLTLKNLAPHEHFKLVKTYTLPMTWSKTSPVYLYVLDRTIVEPEPETAIVEEDVVEVSELEEPAAEAPASDDSKK